jgi:hypothetical protein
MQSPAWLGLGALLLHRDLRDLRIRQGMKVKKQPEDMPPEQWPHG